MKKAPAVPLPLPSTEPWDPDEHIDPGWVQLVHAAEDGNFQPLIKSLRDADLRMPSMDMCLREFLADCLGKVKRGRGRPKQPPRKTFVQDFDGIGWTTVTKTNEKVRKAAIWVSQQGRKRGSKASLDKLVIKAADMFNVDRRTLDYHLRSSKRRRGVFSI